MYITTKVLPDDGDVKDKKPLAHNVHRRCEQTTIVVVNKGGFSCEISVETFAS